MLSSLMLKSNGTASLSGSRSANTVRLRWLMTEQRKLEIAARLRELYEESGETYLSIADALGVRERTVASWLSPTSPEPISYKSAKKFAEHFNRSIDWLWRGEEDIRVPADFMERFAALEKEVQELRAGRAVGAARRATGKSPLQSRGTQPSKAKKRRAE